MLVIFSGQESESREKTAINLSWLYVIRSEMLLYRENESCWWWTIFMGWNCVCSAKSNLTRVVSLGTLGETVPSQG